MIQIEVNQKSYKRAQKIFKETPKVVPKITKSAINKTVRQSDKELHTQLKSDYSIKVSEVKRGVTHKKATVTSLSGAVVANGPVTRLKTGFRTKTDTPKAFTASIKKRSKKSLPSKAFVATMPKSKPNQKSQHTGIFIRTGKKRLGIRELTGPSIAGMANSKNIKKDMKKIMVKRFNENFDKEVDKVLGK